MTCDGFKNWKLFIDDERFPKYPDFIIARSSLDAIWMFENYGIPNEIAFDHDLGGEDTAMVVVSWMEEQVYCKDNKLPEGFKFSVHSQNPVGARNIEVAMSRLVEYSDQCL